MNPSDTIGLTDFLVLVYKFIKRNILIIGSFTLVGLILGVVSVNQKPNYYSSELIGFSNVINKTTLLEILSPLTTLADEKNHKELSTKLNLTIEEASKIRTLNFLESKHTKTSHAPAVTDKKLGNLILIQTLVYDKSILENLEKGIYFYLDNNAYIKETKSLEKNRIQTLITEISKNIALIDSLNLAKTINKNSSGVTIQSEINPRDYKETVFTIENLRIQIEVLKSFTVVSNFYKLDTTANKNIINILASTLAFLLLGLMVISVKELALLAQE